MAIKSPAATVLVQTPVGTSYTSLASHSFANRFIAWISKIALRIADVA